MSQSQITIQRTYHPERPRIRFAIMSTTAVLLAASYCFLLVATTISSSDIRTTDRSITKLTSSIASLEVEYFNKASTIGPSDVTHLAMTEVPEESISYLVFNPQAASTVAMAR